MKSGFIKFFTLTFCSLTCLCLICNFIVDPLQYYRCNPTYPLYGNERWQVSAFIHTFPFDTALVGTSMTQNFSLRYARETLGVSPIKLSMAGATMPEQILVVETAIKTGKVKRVIWGIDRCYFHTSKNGVNSEIPTFLYKRKADAHIKYLLNLDMLFLSFRLILRGTTIKLLQLPKHELETYNAWWQDANFSKTAVLEMYKSALLQGQQQFLPAYSTRRCVFESFLTLIRSNPQVEFNLFLPPYSLAYYKIQYATNKEAFYEDIAFRKELLEALSKIKNVKIFDFETDLKITTDLDNYKDFTHYSNRVNEYIIDCIATHKRRLVGLSDIHNSQAIFQNLPYRPIK